MINKVESAISEGRCVLAIVRVDAHAETGCDPNARVADLEFAVERLQHLLDDGHQAGAVAHLLDQDGELVAADPGNRVLAAYRGLKLIGDQLLITSVTATVISSWSPWL